MRCSIGIGAIFALLTSIAHVHGSGWLILRIANAVVFVIAAATALACWMRDRGRRQTRTNV